jgi:hypothetical protein
MKVLPLLIVLLMALNSNMTAQTSQQYQLNYVSETSVNYEGITLEEQLESLDVGPVNKSISYYDGLGRLNQEIKWKLSPNRKDIVQPFFYDNFGRETYKFLPYEINESFGYGDYKPNALRTEFFDYSNSDQYQFYQNHQHLPTDIAPYSNSIIENSSLGILREQGAFGAKWQPNTSQSATIKKASFFNIENEVWQFIYVFGSANNFGEVKTVGAFPAKELIKEITFDEHHKKNIQYLNKEGKVILKKIQVKEDNGMENNDNFLLTYYVYDDFDNLRLVIPPQAFFNLSQNLGENSTITSDFIKTWCFSYHYDKRRRIVEKSIPGSGVSYLVYDKYDRLVLSQDEKNRMENKWLFYKYDQFDRKVLNGLIVIQGDRLSVQGTVNDFYSNTQNSIMYESFTLQNNIHGYTNRTFPVSINTNDVLTATYYDSYDFLNDRDWDQEKQNYSFSPDDFGQSKFEACKTLITGQKEKVIGENYWLNKVIYYNDRYQEIQRVSENYLGGIDRVVRHIVTYIDRPLNVVTIHTGVKDIKITKSFDYDHAGRLKETYHWIGSDVSKEILLSRNTYNSIGQLIDKKLGVKGLEYVQSIDYRYNIRGWLTNINKSDLSNDQGAKNDDDDDLFGMEMMYEEENNLQPSQQ